MNNQKIEQYQRDMEKHACGGAQLLLFFFEAFKDAKAQIDENTLNDGVEYCKAKRKLDIVSNPSLTDKEIDDQLKETDSYFKSAEESIKRFWRQSGRIK